MKPGETLARSGSLLIFFFLFSSFVLFGIGSSYRIQPFQDTKLGVNYGRLGSNLPSPQTAAKLINSLSIKNVKTFDMDLSVIRAFSNTGISLSVCIPNEYISSVANDPSQADLIIKQLSRPLYSNTKISSITVGTEVSMLPEFSTILLKAMNNVYESLKKFGLHQNIQVSTPHSLAILAVRFPPSDAIFQESIAEPVLRPLLAFLDQINSSFMVNLYPYLTYKEAPSIPLEFALFADNPKQYNYTDPNTGLLYTNLFDLLVDALNSAAFSLGFYNLPLVVTETGWPTQGNPEDTAASLHNAAIFNQRLVEHVTRKPIKGTPLRPGVPVLTFIFALFDEDMKGGAPTEKHWGLFYANGTRKYDLRTYDLPHDAMELQNKETSHFSKFS
ncbi:Glucan endo-1,3-beta-glucosidase 12 [Acorus gramineus]|uniref:Glucan endo-1,3-beta-glucosidase 12 n=1 Tax=Acorus gramineus TaxID=55184 RepID=A0AAV9BGA6_ACOGR|nr:Glucan endo-1,3-beta-glucosidase 12 [Acorus gramineus]